MLWLPDVGIRSLNLPGQPNVMVAIPLPSSRWSIKSGLVQRSPLLFKVPNTWQVRKEGPMTFRKPTRLKLLRKTLLLLFPLLNILAKA